MKHYSKAFTIILTISIIFILWITFAYEHSNITITSSPLKELPVMQIKQTDKTCQYSASLILSEEFNNSKTLLFKTSHLKLKVFIDNEIIYSFGYEENSIPFLKSPGTSWHVISLPALSGSSLLVMDFQTPYDNFSGFVPSIQYGTKGDCIAAYQNSSIYALFSILIILFGGLAMIVIYFFTRIKKNPMSKTFLYISSFALFVSIWILFQSGSIQLFAGYPQVIYYIDLISLILFPIPINIYIYNMCLSNKSKGIVYFAWAYILVLIMNLFLQITSVVDMYELVVFTHILMAANIIYMSYLIFVELQNKNNKELRNFLLPLLSIIVGGSVEMILYYYHNMTSTSIALRISIVIFLVIVITNSIRRYYYNVMDLRQKEYFERLAKTDLLTCLSNRNRYEEVLSSHEKTQVFSAVLFDLNSLKYINDNYGHATGDLAIKLCAECMKKAFSAKGECFRIGGDEFAVIVKDNESLQKECQVFEEIVSEYDKKHDFPFSIAYGIAVFDLKIDKNSYETVKRADYAMYQMKQIQKSKYVLK